MQEKGKNKITIIFSIIGIFIFVGLIITSTYAYWILTKKQEDTNIVQTACLNFELTDANSNNTGINLTDAWPMSDSEGLASDTNEYGFVVTNKCNKDMYYEISLGKNVVEESLDSSFVVVGLDNQKVGIFNTLQDRFSQINSTVSNLAIQDARLIGSGKVSANSSKNHELKLWIDENTPISEQGKWFSGSIFVTAGQGIEEQSPKSISILNDGDIDEVGTEVAIGDEHFYVISSDDDSVTMLSKYNLLVGYVFNAYAEGLEFIEEKVSEYTGTEEGYNLQSPNALGYVGNFGNVYGTVPFSFLKYWNSAGSLKPQYGNDYPAYVYDDNSLIKEYVDMYKIKLNNKYRINVLEARLITYDEIVGLGCTPGENCRSYGNVPEWVYSTSYWSGTADGDIYAVVEGDFRVYSRNIESKIGVRPVITIAKSEFSK